MTVIPLPRHGQWAWDLRGQGRGVRASAHADDGLLNVSLWREGTCVGTAQLLPADVAKLVSGLSEGLAEIAAPGLRPRAAPSGSGLEERLAASSPVPAGSALGRRCDDRRPCAGRRRTAIVGRFAGCCSRFGGCSTRKARETPAQQGSAAPSPTGRGSSPRRPGAATTSTPTSTSSRLRP